MDSLIGAPREVVGVCGSGMCSHGTGRVAVLSCRRLGSAAQGRAPSKPFDQCMDLAILRLTLAKGWICEEIL